MASTPGSAPFRRPVTVRFDEADPRGILFYGRIFELVHRIFEDFVVSGLGIPWDDWFMAGAAIIPVKHVEATFHRPLRPGRAYQAEVSIAAIGDSSFEVVTRVAEAGEVDGLCAETRVVHAFADHQRRKVSIPSEIRARLDAYVERK